MSALIYCPFPSREAARAVATNLLDAKLVACVNILGDVEALFDWDAERGTAEEVAVLMKTDASVLAAAVARLEAEHPYEAPAILGWRCDVPGSATAAWLGALGSAK